MTPVPVLVTADEADSICHSLRYTANDMQSNLLTKRQRAVVYGLLILANQYEARYLAAEREAARVEVSNEEQ